LALPNPVFGEALKMKKLAVILLSSMCLIGCTTTNTRLATETTQRPAVGSKLAIVEPEVSLGVLNAVGMKEPREDWNKQALENLSAEISAAVAAKNLSTVPLNADQIQSRRLTQLLQLNDVVGQSIQAFSYGPIKLPTKPGFEWTLGSGVSDLQSVSGADYALFVNANGTYASGARVGMAIGMALVGASVPLGSQTVQLSLVDLKTGNIVWYNNVLAGPGADMRSRAGAKSLVEGLLKDIPL
jgi:PBP1b-binding outer membrane lipoprotein LpoB